MRKASATIDRRRPFGSPAPRIVVVLTTAEAAQLVARLQQDPDAAALTGLAKIRMALEPAPASPEPGALSPAPLLRAKAYRTREEPPAVVSRFDRRRSSSVPRSAGVGAELADDYVPWRDEADGQWK